MTRRGRSPADAALIYARRGWPVFPCHNPVPTRSGCSCRRPDCSSPAKHPRITGGLKAATTDEHEIAAWWRRWPAANVAIRTGTPSGLVVVDVDPDHGGERTLHQLIAEHGPLPPGRTIRTGSGGLHLYFAHPGETVRNDTGRRLGPGVDIRGDGGYVISPPSRHRNGQKYRFEQHPRLIPQLPEWLAVVLQPPPPPKPARPLRNSEGPLAAEPSVSAWGQAALEGELRRLQHAPEGTRNDTLNRVAFRLGQIVAHGALDETSVETELVAQATAIGLPLREAQATVWSGLTAGEQQPRGPVRSDGHDLCD